MVSLRFMSAFAAATLLSMVSAQTTTTNQPSSTVWTITTPSATVVGAREMKDVGCFNSSEPLEDHGFYVGRSPGNCQLVCIWLNKPVMALSDGTNCWCGDLIPANNTRVDMSQCNTVCRGTALEKCGGPKKLHVIRTSITDNEIDYFVPPVVESSSTSSPPPRSTSGPQGSIQTSGAPASSDNNSGGSNKTAIAVGVVVGVVALFAIVGGVLFYLRQKRRREVEEEFRRQANINSFTAGGKLHTSNSSMTDSRLDPEFMNRRQSNGSIADNEDYSRRILKVTNA